jgi:hypothetical protein
MKSIEKNRKFPSLMLQSVANNIMLLIHTKTAENVLSMKNIINIYLFILQIELFFMQLNIFRRKLCVLLQNLFTLRFHSCCIFLRIENWRANAFRETRIFIQY